MIRLIFSVTWLLFVESYFHILPAQALGRISGTVGAEEGALPPGTILQINKVPEYVNISRTKYPPRFEVVRATIRAPQNVSVAANGLYDVPGLPSGRYQLCAIPPEGYLENCLWTGVIDVIVPPGSTVAVRTLSLRRGAVVQVRVDDPQALLPAVDTSGARRAVIGVMTTARAFRGAKLQSIDAGGRNLVITVPFDRPLQLWVNPVKVSIRAPDGSTVLRARSAAAFQASRLTPRLEFRLQATPGVAP